MSRSSAFWVFRKSAAIGLILAIFAVVTGVPRASAQTDLPAESRANLVIELNPGILRDSPMGALVPLDQVLKATGLPLAEMIDIEWGNLRSLKLVARLPKDISSVVQAGQVNGALPLELMVVAKSDPPGAFAAFRTIVESDSNREMVNGTLLWSPKNGPPNVAAAFPDDSTMILGTRNYLSRIGSEVVSEETLALLGRSPESIVRFALDVSQHGALMKELETFLGSPPPEIRDVVAVILASKRISGHLGISGEQLLALRVETGDPQKLSDIQKLLSAVPEAIRNNPPAAMGTEKTNQLVQELGANTEVTTTGNEVSLVIRAPKNFAVRLATDVVPVALAAQRKSIEAIREMNDLRQVALAMHLYADQWNRFPQFESAGGGVDLSWRVLVLPYLEQEELFKKVDTKQAWDSPANAVLADSMPKQFGDDGRSRILAIAMEKQPRFFHEIQDGTSNTIAFIRVQEGVPWAANRDISIDEVVQLFDAMNGEGTVQVAMYDGSVRQLAASIDRKKLRGMLTPNGGEIVD